MDTAAVNNPVSYNQGLTDCDVFKYNGEYYITGNWLAGDMLRSRDLESWGERRHIFSWNNSWHTANHSPQDLDIHAGHIRYSNGVFHFYTQLEPPPGSSETYSITHAIADNPWGPYTEVNDAPFATHIDAETFRDEDGLLYFYSTRFTGGNQNYVRRMSDPWTFSGNYIYQISGTAGWEGNTFINEGPKVIKYRNTYYMLYNAYATDDARYSIGCVESTSPTGFNNSLKYTSPVCTRYTPPGADEIAYIGQAWVVDGPNGFEKWLGYFAQTPSEGRTQRIDRMHFFDRTLFVDGPTDRYTPGYHPAPAKPQLLNIFSEPDGPLSAQDWSPQAGSWSVVSEEAVQSDPAAWALNPVNRVAAKNYLIEANLKFTQAQDAEDKAGVMAYYQDANNFVIVGLNRVADDWYVHVRESGVDTVYSGNYGGSVNYSVYHKIRVTKNGNQFEVRIDDMIPPGFSRVSTAFDGAGVPGVFTDHTTAAFDGVIYTIGWDEFDGGITGWGDHVNGITATGSWSVGSDGITLANGTGYTFKGELMEEYEVAAQVYKEGATDGSMGLFAVAIDGTNFIRALIDLTTDELVVGGLKNGLALPEQRVAVPSKTEYNIRAVKLPDRVILFVDGEEMLTVNETYGAAQVGLYTVGMSARFNGIMAYRTEPKFVPAPWTKSDLGAVGFPGTADYSDHAIYMSGSGSDIWDVNDEFTFVHMDKSGDWEMSTRVVNLDESGFWSKAALMFRNDLTSNSAMVMLGTTGGADGLGHVQMIWRNYAGQGTPARDVAELSYPIWLKLTRQGSTFSGAYSTNGQNWVLLGSETLPLNPAGKLGFGVTAQNNSRIATAVFDHIAIPDIPVGIPKDLSAGDFTAFAAPFRLYASDFFSSQGHSFAASQWQLSASSTFSSPSWDSGETFALNYSAVPANIAAPGDYGRARYQNNQGEWSAWSAAYALDFSNHTLALWRFEEGINGVQHPGVLDGFYQDASGNENHLSAGSNPTATNNLPFATVPQLGAINELSLYFSNNNLGTFGAQTGGKMIEDYLFNQGWTVEASFKTRTRDWQIFVGKDGQRGDLGGAVGAEPPFLFKLRGGSGVVELLCIDNNGAPHSIYTLEAVELNQWYSIAATYDNSVLKLYLKGEADPDYILQGSASVPAGATLGLYANPWTLGRGMWNGAPADTLYGQVDEVRISNTPLNTRGFIHAQVGDSADLDVDGMADVWELQYFDRIENSVPTEDPDHDWLSNLAEYALGGNPTNPASTGHPISFEQDGALDFKYVYPRRISPPNRLNYYLETTEDLVSGTWTNSGYTALPNTGSIDAEFEAVTNQIPADAPSTFIRLIVE